MTEDFLGGPIRISDGELLQEVMTQRDLMIAVSTGGPRIADVNIQYTARRTRIQRQLSLRGLTDPNPYSDLWAWYGKWSSGDLPSYQSRRAFISDLYGGLVDRLTGLEAEGARVFSEPTGWTRVDRDLGELRRKLAEARTEADFQAIGHLSREILITLAQAVFDPQRHRAADGVEPSNTDAKRMLESYISAELSGSSNEALRRHAKAALDVSNDLQHRRTATFREAALCAEATTSVVNLIAIIAGRRDQ
jgi:hypothetical protein